MGIPAGGREYGDDGCPLQGNHEKVPGMGPSFLLSATAPFTVLTMNVAPCTTELYSRK